MIMIWIRSTLCEFWTAELSWYVKNCDLILILSYNSRWNITISIRFGWWAHWPFMKEVASCPSEWNVFVITEVSVVWFGHMMSWHQNHISMASPCTSLLMMISNTDILAVGVTILITQCGILMPYGNINLVQHWFRVWLVAWRPQAITSTNIDLKLTSTQAQL